MEKESSIIRIRPLDRFNWESALQLQLEEEQEDMMPSVLHSIAQSKFENLYPYGIFDDSTLVGFIMYGEFHGLCWINRILVDKFYQKLGVGTKALHLMIDLLNKHPKCREVRTSFDRRNALAEYFFSKNGFRRINDGMDDEIVMRYVG